MSISSEWEVVDVYSTKQAVEDGFLVRIEEKVSKEAGIKYPVYLTRGVWDKYVRVPEGFEQHQDLDGRLWDVVFMFAFAARTCSHSCLNFQLNVALPESDTWEDQEVADPDLEDNHILRLITLKAVIQAQDFDDLSPAIFIMKPSED